MVLALVRGDHRLNEIKLRNALGADFRQASAEEIEAELGPPGFIGPVGAQVPVIKDAAIQGVRLLRRRQQARHPPDRGRARPRLRVQRARLPLGRGRRPVAVGRPDRDRDGDRGRQHLQARDPLLGAARRHLPRPGRQGAADRDGLLRDRPGADRRRRDRAGRRRAGHRLAALTGAVAGAPGRARQGGRGDVRGGGAPLRGAARSRRSRRCSTTATPGRGRSSPTPSCSAARCGSWSASGRSPRARSRPRSGARGADHRLAVADAARRAGEIRRAARLS